MADVIRINRTFTQEELESKPEIIKINRPFTNQELKSPQSDNLLNKPIETLTKSGSQYVGNIFSAIGHPIQTIKGIGEVAIGGVEKLIPGEQSREKNFNAVVDLFKQRYGSLENAKKTALEDPVGFAGDVSTLLSGAGGIAGLIGKAGNISKISEVGRVVGRSGSLVEPVSAATRGIGRLAEVATAGRKIAPFASKLDMPVINAAKEIGVELPASAISTSKAVPAIEALTGKGFFGDEIVKKVNNAQVELSKYADNVITQTGKAEDMSSAGQAVFKGADKYRNNFIQIKNELYDKALLPTGKTENIIKVKPNQSLPFVKTILLDKERAANILGKSEDIGYFKNLAKNLNSPLIDGTYFKSAIKELNQKLNTSFADPFVSGNQGTLKKLVTLLSEDLDKAIIKQRPDLAKAIRKANEFYSEGISKLNSVYGEKIFKFAKAGQYDKIIPAIINKGASIEDIPRIFEVIGKENVPSLQSAFLEDLFKSSKGVNGNFTSGGITSQINKIGGETKLQAILTPRQFSAVKNLETVARGLGKAEKIAGGSQTAFLGRMFAETSGLFIHPLLSAKIILGDALFSKFVSSPIGQKLLTTGIDLTGKIGKNIAGIAPKLTTPVQITRIGGINKELQ